MSQAGQETISIYHPKVLLLSGGVTAGAFFSFRFYGRFIRRRRTYLDLTPRILDGQQKLRGRVTRVGDGDNFRFYHTPGGALMGWGWARKVPEKRKDLKNETLMIRLCGVDAPERAHFGNPSQPFSEEALWWLQKYLMGRSVTITPYSIDQYKRVVARAQVWKLTGKKDVSAEMLRNGLAVVYEANQGAEYGENEHWYRKLEAKAKAKKRGLWSQGRKLVTPGDFKKNN
ncbi:SNase-domain-containing protein [Metschnikowia bicuspidata var. bicuspidata NRRL YB-4993]|uniref:Probable endonuclease LCL3 n=1 Tax=Metschnikowia bicuspidata var. bicuspidata NRRL YB-4993 TaxID=869754 RepID=A0A1A0H4X1_9ASCO|nr:SNase-domain-containing protein [Metschnikowia bicuspidata var. bicuspidata NRRL YB-4993]OBA18957.1 SNase-domain-containing protein [Metschnikowia bicuspidata var. bicuspidata NRRL YB-4993]